MANTPSDDHPTGPFRPVQGKVDRPKSNARTVAAALLDLFDIIVADDADDRSHLLEEWRNEYRGQLKETVRNGR